MTDATIDLEGLRRGTDLVKRGGVGHPSDPADVEEIVGEASIPVMGKARIGHTKEAQILEAVGVDMIDESALRPRRLIGVESQASYRSGRCHN